MGCGSVGNAVAFGDRELRSGVGDIDGTCGEAGHVVAVSFDGSAVERDGDLLVARDGGGHGGGVASVAVIGPAAEVGIGRIADRGQFRGVGIRNRVAVLVRQSHGDGVAGDAVGSFLAFGDGELRSGVADIDAACGEASHVVAVGFDRSAVEAGGDFLVAGDGGCHGGGVGSVAVIGPAAEVGIGRVTGGREFRGVGVGDRVSVFVRE